METRYLIVRYPDVDPFFFDNALRYWGLADEDYYDGFELTPYMTPIPMTDEKIIKKSRSSSFTICSGFIPFPPYKPSMFLRTGTYCLEITTRSPLSSTASNRPLNAGRTMEILAMFSTVDLDARKQLSLLHNVSSS